MKLLNRTSRRPSWRTFWRSTLLAGALGVVTSAMFGTLGACAGAASATKPAASTASTDLSIKPGPYDQAASELQTLLASQGAVQSTDAASTPKAPVLASRTPAPKSKAIAQTKPESRPEPKPESKARPPRVYEAPPSPAAPLSLLADPLSSDPLRGELDADAAPVMTTASATATTAENEVAPAPIAAQAPVSTQHTANTPQLAAAAAPAMALASEQTGLHISALHACTRIEGFGRFTRADVSRLIAGRATPLLIYVELDGFAHRTAAGLAPPPGAAGLPDDGSTQWIVEVGQELAVFSAAGRLQFKVPEQIARDEAKRRRRDHYLVQRVTIPASLPPGGYSMVVTARDIATDATDQARLSFTIIPAR